MTNDFDYLKDKEYKKFTNEQTLIVENKLIRKKTQDKIGIIYNLQNPNLINQSNKDFINKHKQLANNQTSNNPGVQNVVQKEEK